MRAIRALPAPATGFTLTELLVVIVLLGIVLGMALPSFREATVRNRIVAEHNELQASLMLARSEAIRRNQPVSVCAANATLDDCQNSWGQGWLIWRDVDGDGTVDAAVAATDEPEILQVGQISPADQIAGPTLVTFDRRGQLVTAPGELVLRPQECPAGREYPRALILRGSGQTGTEKRSC